MGVIILDGKDQFSVYHTKRLGGGSYSSVVLGQHKATGKRVAVKVIDGSGYRVRGEIADAEKELAILKKVRGTDHPNLITVLGWWVDGHMSFICMEECTSGLLKYLQHNPVDDRITPRLIAEIVLGLAALRDVGIVHRDIKPENILLTSENHVKIADFGTAILAEDLEASGFAGSPEYAPPEMLENGRSDGTPSDVWSFGCVLYEVYVGKPPFSGSANEVELFERIKDVGVVYPPYLPGDVKDLVGLVLVKGSQDRPGLEDIRRDKYFASVDWCNIHDMCNVTPINADHTTHLDRFLYQSEVVLHSGLVTKTRHLSTKTRVLVATTLPRIFYFDPGTDTIKGDIPIDPDTYATALDEARFDIHTPKRVYTFTDLNKQAHLWSGRINDIVRS
eukprot:TRINITY_DN9955_c0_g1_i1.p1 TRINITY_DN9955_c0_g1~~TRINITY_DN9955_c0_g1_i1.p1  ORF type:complete len:391 (+),score=61.47 TRINITY_DN9955_c0_g1_i1:1724-2896(+)